jgi:hypothetical protein
MGGYPWQYSQQRKTRKDSLDRIALKGNPWTRCHKLVMRGKKGKKHMTVK